MSPESIIKDIAPLIGVDTDDVSVTLTGTVLTIVVKNVDPDDFDDAEEGFDDDDE